MNKIFLNLKALIIKVKSDTWAHPNIKIKNICLLKYKPKELKGKSQDEKKTFLTYSERALNI